MNQTTAKARVILRYGSVLLVLLLTISCSHTEQTTTEDELSPASLFEMLAEEDFSTTQRALMPGFVLESGGSLRTENRRSFIVGRNDGMQKDVPFLTTDSTRIPFEPQGLYEVRFSYTIDEPSEGGFEILFFSSAAQALEDPLQTTLLLNGSPGQRGEAVFSARLKEYEDYQLVMRCKDTGAITVGDIIIEDKSTNTIIAEENGFAVSHQRRLFFRGNGELTIEESTIKDSGFSIFTYGFARFWTNPSLISLPKETPIKLEFEYKITKTVDDQDQIGILRMVGDDGSIVEERSIMLTTTMHETHTFSETMTTGLKEQNYSLQWEVLDGTEWEITNLRLFKKVPLK